MSDQTNPEYYNSHPSGVRPIDIVENLPFNLGSVITYIWRAKFKGAELLDLEKALWYCMRERRYYALSGNIPVTTRSHLISALALNVADKENKDSLLQKVMIVMVDYLTKHRKSYDQFLNEISAYLHSEIKVLKCPIVDSEKM